MRQQSFLDKSEVMMFGLIPKEEKFFEMFKEMTWNIVEGA